MKTPNPLIFYYRPYQHLLHKTLSKYSLYHESDQFLWHVASHLASCGPNRLYRTLATEVIRAVTSPSATPQHIFNSWHHGASASGPGSNTNMRMLNPLISYIQDGKCHLDYCITSYDLSLVLLPGLKVFLALCIEMSNVL